MEEENNMGKKCKKFCSKIFSVLSSNFTFINRICTICITAYFEKVQHMVLHQRKQHIT